MWKSRILCKPEGRITEENSTDVLKIEALSVLDIIHSETLRPGKTKSFSRFFGCRAMNGFLHYWIAGSLL